MSMEQISRNRVLGLVEGILASNGKSVNLSNDTQAHNAYIKFKDGAFLINNPIIKKIVTKTIIDLSICSGKDFKRILTDDTVRSQIAADEKGRSIKFILNKDEVKHNALRKMFKGVFTFDEASIQNPDNVFVIRNADGLAAPMFVEGADEYISEHTHELSQLYHYETGTKYYDARPIKYSTWLANPERQLQTRGFVEA